jgi:tetratricopeptide (TPR) repeat protein
VAVVVRRGRFTTRPDAPPRPHARRLPGPAAAGVRRFGADPAWTRPAGLALLLLALLLAAGSPSPAAEGADYLGAGFADARAALARGEVEAAVRAYNERILAGPDALARAPEAAPAAAWLEARGVPAVTVRSPLLEPRDAAYLAGRLRLRAIARAAIRDAGTPAERAERLFALVVREVAPVIPDGLHERPLDVLVRGYGACDQAAWALVALAEQAGLPGAIVYLRTAPGAESHHSLAALRVDGAWRLYDPFSALRIPDIGLAEAIRDPARLDAVLPGPGAGCLFVARDLAAATVNLTLHPRGQLPRWAAFRNALDTAGLPVLWTDPAGRSRQLRAALGRGSDGAAPGPAGGDVDVRPHQLGYEIYARESEPVWLSRQAGSPSRGPFRTARLRHLSGEPAEALALLEEAAAPDSTDTGSPALLRPLYAARALQALGQYDAAAEQYERVRSLAPGSGWADAVLWNEAACRRALGQDARAANLLRSISGPRRAAASLRPAGAVSAE